MSGQRTDYDEDRAHNQPGKGDISLGVSIVGFILCFLAGAGIMWGIDARHPTGTQASATQATAKPANPGAVRVDLHVMAQCPYGVQAEAAFKDVVAKFGSDLDLHIDYIGQTGSGGEPTSMHGPNEVKGDLLQVCAQKYAPAKAFDFVLCQNENSKEMASNGASCATRIGAPADKITACADGQEGKDLLLESFKRSQQTRGLREPDHLHRWQQVRGGSQADRLHEGDLQRCDRQEAGGLRRHPRVAQGQRHHPERQSLRPGLRPQAHGVEHPRQGRQPGRHHASTTARPRARGCMRA